MKRNSVCSVMDFLFCDYHQFESTGSDFCLLQVEQEGASHLGPELHRVHGPVNHSCFLAWNSVVAARGSNRSMYNSTMNLNVQALSHLQGDEIKRFSGELDLKLYPLDSLACGPWGQLLKLRLWDADF